MSAETTPAVENAARHLNTLHRTDDLHARRREAVIAGRALLDVKDMAEVLGAHRRSGRVSSFASRLVCSCGWVGPVSDHNTHIAAAMRVNVLGADS